jgi:hypothetical protein
LRRPPHAAPERGIAFAAGAACFAAALLGCAHLFGKGLGSTDPWRHIAWARLLRSTPPGALRVWPVFTPFARENVDLWALYHRLLVPFTFGDLELGAHAAAVFYGALSLGALAFALRRINAAAAFTVFVGALGLAPVLLSRALQARPGAITVALLELSALAAILENPAAAFACAWAHAALHISFVLQGVLVAASLLAYGPSRRARNYAAAVGFGSALGVLLRPRPAAYLSVAFMQGSKPFQAAASGLTDLGPELYRPNAALLLLTIPVFLALAWSAWSLRRPGARPLSDRRFLLIAAAAFCAAGMAACRFLDAAGAFAAMAACAAMPASAILPRSRPLRLLVLAALSAALLAELFASTISLSYPYGSDAFRGTAAALRANVRQGAIVFNDDWRSWAKLFFHDPTHRYVIGCDPSLMLAVDPRRFRLWRNLSLEGRPCDAPSLDLCPTSASAGAIAGALREFGAESVVLSRTHEHPRLKTELDSSPSLFLPLDVGSDAARGVAAYLLLPAGTDR